MSKERKATREEAREILKKGICDMSVERLIQLSHYGLIGRIVVTNDETFVNADNAFNKIEFMEESNVIMFLMLEKEDSMSDDDSFVYGSVAFSVDSIEEILGCEDKEKPDQYLNIHITLIDGTDIQISLVY
jgi:hypothetical protein